MHAVRDQHHRDEECAEHAGRSLPRSRGGEHGGAGIGQTTLEFKISLLRPITPETGMIKAEGLVLSRGRRVGTAEGRITDGNGGLTAQGTTTCLIFER